MALALSGKDFSATDFSWPVRVYWEDTDAGGIVYYANYLKFFERARSEWLRSLGLHQQALRDRTGGVFVVTDVQVKYHRPARLDDLLQVRTRRVESGRASLTLQQQSWRMVASATASGATGSGTSGAALASADSELLCEAQIRIGWVDALHMRPQRIPDEVMSALASGTAKMPST
jgi:acyl-CoA thioester hydrolase